MREIEREVGLVEAETSKGGFKNSPFQRVSFACRLAAETETGLKWYDNNCLVSSYEYLLLLGKLKAPTLMSTNRKGLQAVATAAPKPKTAERTLKAGKFISPLQ